MLRRQQGLDVRWNAEVDVGARTVRHGKVDVEHSDLRVSSSLKPCIGRRDVQVLGGSG